MVDHPLFCPLLFGGSRVGSTPDVPCLRALPRPSRLDLRRKSSGDPTWTLSFCDNADSTRSWPSQDCIDQSSRAARRARSKAPPNRIDGALRNVRRLLCATRC
jgi:hypothetical protein